MTEIAIRVENLSKLYHIGMLQQRHDTLRDALTARLRGNPKSKIQNPKSDELWALRDISFEVKRGEVVGIIGRNGAGKSTLLKILSRITEPTSGRAEIHGRVGSLLEVGTGFHPELTGRENIYLNGAILGMRRGEIDRQFDEIVAFAEIERFLDTPVKRYSSGMYVRLAFAVAAHLEPEILLVDEVLAVGDAAFQKKCLGKMGDVAKEGRTVLFVSHNMGAIRRLCSRAVAVHGGQILLDGSSEEAINTYFQLGDMGLSGRTDLRTLIEGRRGSGIARYIGIDLQSVSGQKRNEFRFGEPFRVCLTIESQQDLTGVVWGFSFVANDGTEIQGTTAHDGGIGDTLIAGMQTFVCDVNPQVLTPGRYFIRGSIFRPENVYDHIDEMVSFHVVAIPFDPRKTPSGHYVGHVYAPYRWLRT